MKIIKYTDLVLEKSNLSQFGLPSNFINGIHKSTTLSPESEFTEIRKKDLFKNDNAFLCIYDDTDYDFDVEDEENEIGGEPLGIFVYPGRYGSRSRLYKSIEIDENGNILNRWNKTATEIRKLLVNRDYKIYSTTAFKRPEKESGIKIKEFLDIFENRFLKHLKKIYKKSEKESRKEFKKALNKLSPDDMGKYIDKIKYFLKTSEDPWKINGGRGRDVLASFLETRGDYWGYNYREVESALNERIDEEGIDKVMMDFLKYYLTKNRYKKQEEVMEQLSFKEFVNEGLFRNFVGMAMRSIGSWAAEPLNDMMKDIKQSGDPKKIINSLKTYIQKSGKSIKTQLVNVKSEEDLKKFLNDELLGLYTAIKGVQATQKVNNTYFEEMFKDADKGLVKVMSVKNVKKAEPAIDAYVEDLIKNFHNIVGIKTVKESFLFEDNAGINKLDDTLQKQEKDLTGNNNNNNDEKTKEETSKSTEEESKTEDLNKLKGVTQKWLLNILSPIMKMDPPEKSEQSFIKMNDKEGHEIDRNVAQGVIRKAGFQKFKDFRDTVGDKNEFPL